jgi:3',5'-cyclic AMP phosphodiesterase CpdA
MEFVSTPVTPDGLPPEVPSHLLVHLSDTHLTQPGIAYNGTVDADAALHLAVARLRAAIGGGRHVDAIVASGDLTDTGDPDAYRRLRVALESLAVPIVYAAGNHDVRTAFHEHVLDLPDVHEPVLQVHTVSGLRLIVLDSSVVGSGVGRLTGEHLDELRDELGRRAEHGTIVVLHHAPLPPPSPLLAFFALERASRTALAEAIADSDVRLVLAGHHHLAQSGMLGAVPVAVAGSTAIRTDPLAPPGRERTTRSASINIVAVHRDTITVSVEPIDDAGEVFDLSPDECAEVIAAHRSGPD